MAGVFCVLGYGAGKTYNYNRFGEINMGIDLVSSVTNFYIEPARTFKAVDPDVKDGCVVPGVTYRLLRFDFLCSNVGDSDLHVGLPQNRPDLFEYSEAHGHYHLREFTDLKLFDNFGREVGIGRKQGFCLMDSMRIRNWGRGRAFYHCGYQGISAGWADLYRANLPCQYVIINGVPDGNYILVSTVNPNRVISEDTYENNTIATRLRIRGNTVF